MLKNENLYPIMRGNSNYHATTYGKPKPPGFPYVNALIFRILINFNNQDTGIYNPLHRFGQKAPPRYYPKLKASPGPAFPGGDAFPLGIRILHSGRPFTDWRCGGKEF
jgi:hypothetical protein